MALQNIIRSVSTGDVHKWMTMTLVIMVLVSHWGFGVSKTSVAMDLFVTSRSLKKSRLLDILAGRLSYGTLTLASALFGICLFVRC